MKFWFAPIIVLIIGCVDSPTQPTQYEGVQLTLAQLRGTWRNLDPHHEIAYSIFDTQSPTWRIKGRYGFNFRWQNDHNLFMRDNQLFNSYADDQSRAFWVTLSSNNDTLTLVEDSNSRASQRYVRDDSVGSLNDWMTSLYLPQYLEYKLPIDDISGLAYADSTWFILSKSSGDTARVYVIHMSPGPISSFALSNVSAIDVADGFLWCLKPGVIEKRRIQDAALVSVIGLPFQDYCYGIAVTPQKLFVHRASSAGWQSTLVTLSLAGQVITADSTWFLGDLAYANESLYCCFYNQSHKVSPQTGVALASYEFNNYLGQPDAVANYNGLLAYACIYPGVVRIAMIYPP